ncbi:T9SS type B sorting domain-containing protein [Flavobacterium sediminilitoris]|uniref:T9SS type B sorting domain-containing protein n=1 Tax=Flavobacterium sediminilitoris TaxID=2024526 RepID=A0ABY4HL82_9FLAO|nr:MULTISPECIES: T9SS type B sorting domain-containing protein [Flavobacterium]UOX33630.1 T9SS type B sorting domain-containing protein [Flavobacterium sediminilitoris]
MRSILTLFFTLISIHLMLAQNEPNDCVDAIVVCGNGSFSSNANGVGDIQEVSGCSGFEHNSIWLKINIVQSGTLGFDLIPDDTSITVDYDFWVYGADRSCNNLGSPIRCATTNPQLAGQPNNHTGMNGGTTLTTTGPGANGNSYVRWLTVTAGQSYYIAIDRPVGDGGFQIQWTGTATQNDGAFPTPPVANQIEDYKTCSNTANTGIFDLNSVRNDINPDLVNNTISFYTTLANATDGIDPLPNIISNTSNPQTIYAKVVDNVSGCYNLMEFNLRVYLVPNASISISNTQLCDGEDVTVTFTGTPGASIDYSIDGGTIQSAILDAITGDFVLTQTVTATTTFTLENVKILDSDNVTVLCNQVKNESVTVTTQTLPTVTILGDVTICENTSANINFTGTPNAEITYTIDGGTNQVITLDNSGQASITTPVLTSNSVYTLISATSTTAPFCSQVQSGTATITVIPLPTATIMGSTTCSNSTGTIAINGTPNAEVTYSVDGGTNQMITLDGTGEAIITTPILTSDSFYTLHNVAIGICNQPLNETVAVSVISSPTASISTTTPIICKNSTGTITINGTPNAEVTYSVDGGTNQIITLDGTGEAIITTSILTSNVTYNLVNVAIGTCNNQLTDNITITVNDLPTATITGDTICANNTGTITINGTPNAEVTYTVDSGTNQTITLNGTGQAIITTPVLTTNSNYNLINIVSNSSPFCSQTLNSSAQVIVNPKPVVTATPNTQTICSASLFTAQLNSSVVTGNIMYNWTVVQAINVTGATSETGFDVLTNLLTLVDNTVNGLVEYSITVTVDGCISDPVSVFVTVTPKPIISNVTYTDTICSGTTTDIVVTGSQNYIWNATVQNIDGNYQINGDETNINQIATLFNTSDLGYITLNIIPVLNGCEGDSYPVSIVVTPIPTVDTINFNLSEICSGDELQVSILGNPTGTVYDWVALLNGVTIQGGTTFGTTSGLINLIVTTSNPEIIGTLSFEITPRNGSCVGTPILSDEITVYPQPGKPIVLQSQTICSGGSPNFDIIVENPIIVGTEVEWTVLQSVGVTGATGGFGVAPVQINTDVLVNTSNTQGFVIYRAQSKLGNCTGEYTDYTVYVDPFPKPILEDGTICVEQATGLVFQKYRLYAGNFIGTNYSFTWYESSDPINHIAITNVPTLEVDSAGSYYVVVENVLTGCAGTSNIVIVTEINPATAIDYTVTNAFTDNATIEIILTGGNGEFQYQIDDGAFQNSNVFTNVSGGLHNVSVVDTQGCTYLTIDILVIDYPKFFTPNGDGIHDTWNITTLRGQSDSKIHIFDRYGKLIKQISPNGTGWDGTFNGQQLPSTDYWFTIEYSENLQQKIFKAHFSLKR